MNHTSNPPPSTSHASRAGNPTARIALWVGLALALVLPIGLLMTPPAPMRASAQSQAQGCVPIVLAIHRSIFGRGQAHNSNHPFGALFAGQTAQVTRRLSDNSWYRVIFGGREGWV